MSTNQANYDRSRKTYQELTFTDDFMFRKVMRNNEKLCKAVIELLLDVKVNRIVYKEDNQEIKVTPDSRGIRLDVYLEDEEGTVFDLEMQNSNHTDLPKRARYYQSVIDRDNLGSGVKYKKLPESYIVFICTFDPFGAGLPKYEFRENCVEDLSIELGDETRKVFINAKSMDRDITENMRAFLDYICGLGASSELTREIESDIIQAKALGKWEVEYMTFEDLIMEEKESSYEEGHAEGREKTKYEDVEALVAEGTFDAAKACEVLGVDPDEYNNYLKALE